MNKLRKRILNQLDPNFRSNYNAKSAKRLDLVAAQVADAFHLAGFAGKYPLRNKTTLEIGSGWVLSHSLVFWLLGAKKCIATDLEILAKPGSLKYAVNEAVASIVCDILAPFEDHEVLRDRMNILKNTDFTFDSLKKLNIHYNAPVDLAKNRFPEKVDFVFSNSVLEHVPVTDIQPLLEHLSESLNTGGIMINRIHLEDHKDTYNHPFDFFIYPSDQYDRNFQTARGNRLRESEWIRVFDKVKALNTSILFHFKRMDKSLPVKIDPSVCYTDENDLRSCNLGTFSIKSN